MITVNNKSCFSELLYSTTLQRLYWTKPEDNYPENFKLMWDGLDKEMSDDSDESPECEILDPAHFIVDNEDSIRTISADPYLKYPQRKEPHSVKVTDHAGVVIYECDTIIAPASWSDESVRIVAQKYFRVDPESGQRETSVYEMCARVVDTIVYNAIDQGYVKSQEAASILYNHLVDIVLDQRGAWNSPVWFNVGIEKKPQVSACFILETADSLVDGEHSIMGVARSEAAIFKGGSGAGSNRSALRSKKELTSRGNYASGPMSFMRIWDVGAGVTKSGSTARRAAKMEILNAVHPDIEDFIEAKTKEEKVAKALITAGYSADFTDPEGAYSKAFFQNSNFSVRADDQFMQAVRHDGPFETKYVTTGETCKSYFPAHDLFPQICQSAWECGDPGLQFDDTINKWHTIPNSGRINASNPCSEYMSCDNSACNLASLRLTKYQVHDMEGGFNSFDYERFAYDIMVMSFSMEILISIASYPTDSIRVNALNQRQLGIGYADLGALLLQECMSYGSEESLGLVSKITSTMTATTYLMSALVAKYKGAFADYEANSEEMKNVIMLHRDASIDRCGPDHYATDMWRQAQSVSKHSGYRNAQASVLAPTGTISFLMGCDTTGVEPSLSHVQYKTLVGSGETIKLINRSSMIALKNLGYASDVIAAVERAVDETGVFPIERVLPVDRPVFLTALPDREGKSLGWKAHLNVMAAAQPFLSGAISKTVNLPNDATTEDIAEVYMAAWSMQLKAIAIYRDGCKATQAVSAKPKNLDIPLDEALVMSVSEDEAVELLNEVLGTEYDLEELTSGSLGYAKLPPTRDSITHEFSLGMHKFRLIVSVDDEDRPREIFLICSKIGSMLRNFAEGWATAVSLGLRQGVPVEKYIKVYEGTVGEPSGMTSNPDIRMAKSFMDYVARFLELQFVTKSNTVGARLLVAETKLNSSIRETQGDACLNCGKYALIRSGSCYTCNNCGETTGCS